MGEYRFDRDTRVVDEGGDRWSAGIDPGWCTVGGIPNGGYMFAVTLAGAARHPLTENRRLVTATVHFARPGVAGPAEVDVRPVKGGRVTSTVSAALSQDGRERTRALATYGDPDALEGPAEHTIEPPAIPGPDACVAPPTAVDPVPGLHLLKRYDYRVPATCGWARSTGTGGGAAMLDGWIRFSDGRAPDLAALPLLADAFPPALGEVVGHGSLHVATLELTVHVRAAPVPGWIQTHTESRHVVGRLVEEDTYLWDGRGTLVAMARQLGLRPERSDVRP